jgi:hypothetical protein
MILDKLFLTQFSNEVSSSTGIDCQEYCADKLHFLNYHKLVMYTYNTRGFRDDEWPADLTQIYTNAWCVGDSFTVGLGQPQEEIWPYLLKEQIPELIFNVSLNGASNDWISRKVRYILEHTKPKYIFIQWSYLHRREHPNSDLSDENRRLHYIPTEQVDSNKDLQDIENFIKNLDTIKTDSIIVHSFIPNFAENPKIEEQIYEEMKKRQLNFFPAITPLDKSRDGHHYDVQTAAQYVKCYLQKI